MKERGVLLSVIVPAYNVADTIERALGFAEQYSFDARVEIIIINDGSTDGTRKVCEKILSHNTNQNVMFELVNQSNAGHGSAINYGIKKAKGKYLRILDADDYFDSDAFEQYLEFLSDCDSDLVCSDYSEVRSGENSRFYWHDGKRSFTNKKYGEIIEQTSPYLLPCATVKTRVLREAHALIDEKCCYDDQEYDFLIIKLCQTASYFAGSVYCYVVGNVEQSISQKSLIRHVRDHQRVVEWLVKHYYNSDLPGNKKRFVFDKMVMPLCHHQYYIAVDLKKSRKDFLNFDGFLKKYKELYNHPGVAGKRLKMQRASKGLFI